MKPTKLVLIIVINLLFFCCELYAFLKFIPNANGITAFGLLWMILHVTQVHAVNLYTSIQKYKERPADTKVDIARNVFALSAYRDRLQRR